MKVEVTNTLSRVWGTEDEMKQVDDLTSYPVAGAEFSDAYRNGYWDGREHLLRKSRKGDYHIAPTGVMSEVCAEFPGAEMVDMRRKPTLGLWTAPWLVQPLRDYQSAAVKAALKNRGVFSGKGILNLPIRSGKTRTAAALARALGCRTLFVVPSDLLLGQTINAFKECFGQEFQIGMVGEGEYDTKEMVTVATIQSLLAGLGSSKHKSDIIWLLANVDLLFVDENHHMEGPAWRNIAMQCDAWFKIGLSATVFVSRLRENQSANIWMKAVTGGILYRVSMGRLIKAGMIMAPNITFLRFQHPQSVKGWSWQRVVRDCVATCRPRNKLLADVAVKHAREGTRVLIDTGRLDQMKELYGYISAMGVEAEVVHGKTPSAKRWKLIEAFQAGDIQVLIGTVFGEGIDIPEIEVVINAEGQKSEVAAIQRMRNLTPHHGKTSVKFYDVMDIGQRHLAAHSLNKLRLYKGLRGFTVNVI